METVHEGQTHDVPSTTAGASGAATGGLFPPGLLHIRQAVKKGGLIIVHTEQDHWPSGRMTEEPRGAHGFVAPHTMQAGVAEGLLNVHVPQVQLSSGGRGGGAAAAMGGTAATAGSLKLPRPDTNARTASSTCLGGGGTSTPTGTGPDTAAGAAGAGAPGSASSNDGLAWPEGGAEPSEGGGTTRAEGGTPTGATSG